MGDFFRKWSQQMICAVCGGLLSGFLAWNHDYVRAAVETVLFEDGITGTYMVKTWEYDHNQPKNAPLVPFSATLDIKQGGSRVFGTKEANPTRKWTVFGYLRGNVLSIAYESAAKGGVGTGTYTMQRIEPNAFRGYWTGVDCKNRTLTLLICPAILYRVDHQEYEHKYDDFLRTEQCKELSPEAVESCPVQQGPVPQQG